MHPLLFMKLLEDKKIKIGDREFTAKMGMRTMINFEKLSGHSIDSIETLEDAIMLFYASVKRSTELTYDEFLDLIDDDMDAVNDFTQWAMVGAVEKKQTDLSI